MEHGLDIVIQDASVKSHKKALHCTLLSIVGFKKNKMGIVVSQGQKAVLKCCIVHNLCVFIVCTKYEPITLCREYKMLENVVLL